MTKIISFYAGQSWAEIEVDPPPTYYWDFDDPRYLSGDSHSPGTYLCSNGETGPVKKLTDKFASQVKVHNVSWAVKFNKEKLFLGMLLPDGPAHMVIGPGGGMGGIGIEHTRPVSRFVTIAGALADDPRQTMERLQKTLDMRNPPRVTVYAIQYKNK